MVQGLTLLVFHCTGHGSHRHSDSQLGHQTSVRLTNVTRGVLTGHVPGKGTGNSVSLEQLVPGYQDTTGSKAGAEGKAAPTPLLSLCPALTTATNGLRTCRATGWTSSRMEKGQELEGRNSAVNDPEVTSSFCHHSQPPWGRNSCSPAVGIPTPSPEAEQAGPAVGGCLLWEQQQLWVPLLGRVFLQGIHQLRTAARHSQLHESPRPADEPWGTAQGRLQGRTGVRRKHSPAHPSRFSCPSRPTFPGDK